MADSLEQVARFRVFVFAVVLGALVLGLWEAGWWIADHLSIKWQ